MAELDGLSGSVLSPRQQVLGEQVLQQLRVLIITGKIESGTHLVESQLSDSFNVSRGPIRDALVQLQAEGLVESRRRGVYARGLSVRDIDELYTVREAIEVMALRVGSGAPAAAWKRTEGPLSEMMAAAKAGDHLRFAHADMAFHGSFYEIAGNTRLHKIWRQYEPTFAVMLELTTAEDVDLGPSYDSHAEIHRQMVDGDVESATLSLREHLIGSRSRLVSAFARMALLDELDNGDLK